MNNILKSVMLVLASCAVAQASGQDHLTWPKLNVGSVYWHVDEESVSKVGNTIFFDGFINPRPEEVHTPHAGRGGVSCDGTTFYRLSEAWPQDYDAALTSLKRVLDSRRSTEPNASPIPIPRGARTPEFRARLASLCKTSSRPDRELLMAMSNSGSRRVNLGRLSTFSRVNTNTVEIWIDEVLLEGFQPSALRDGKWVPSFLNDGTPDLVDIVKTDRDGANRWRIDCARQRFAFMSVVKYGANGTVTESREKSGALSEADWSLVVPDSVGEMVLLAACKL